MKPEYIALIIPLIVLFFGSRIAWKVYNAFKYSFIDQTIAKRMNWFYGTAPLTASYLDGSNPSKQKEWQDMQLSIFKGLRGTYKDKQFCIIQGTDGDALIQITHDKKFNGFKIFEQNVSLVQDDSLDRLVEAHLEGNEFGNTFWMYAKDGQDPYYDINPAGMARLVDTYKQHDNQLDLVKISGVNNTFQIACTYKPLKEYDNSSSRKLDKEGLQKQKILTDFLDIAIAMEQCF